MPPAAVARLTSKSLSEAVRERLMRLIAAGELRPGDRLNEMRLAENFGISRGPIREAARELEGQGFLLSRPNQGFFVTNFTQREIRDIYEAKDWMEAALISDLAAHTDRATRASALAEIDAVGESDRVAFAEAVFRFRLRAAAHIHNRFLADLMIALYRKFYIISALLQVGEPVDRQRRIVCVLRDFWTAMRDDDIAAARRIMKDDTAFWLADLPDRFPAAREIATDGRGS